MALTMWYFLDPVKINYSGAHSQAIQWIAAITFLS